MRHLIQAFRALNFYNGHKNTHTRKTTIKLWQPENTKDLAARFRVFHPRRLRSPHTTNVLFTQIFLQYISLFYFTWDKIIFTKWGKDLLDTAIFPKWNMSTCTFPSRVLFDIAFCPILRELLTVTLFFLSRLINIVLAGFIFLFARHFRYEW